MKWFQHQSNSHRDFNVEPFIEKYGTEGYGLYWMCGEIVAEKGVNYKLSEKVGWKRYLMTRSKFPEGKLNEILLEMAEQDLIDKKALSNGVLYMPKIEKYSDDYTKRIQRGTYGGWVNNTNNVRTMSEQDTDSVRPDKIRGDKIILDKNIYTSINFLKNIPEDDLKELTLKYSVSKKFIKDRADDVIDYCEAKGKIYRNYKAALRNFCKSHLIRHPECIIIKQESPKIEEDKRSPEEKIRDRERRDKILLEARQKIGKQI